MMDAPRPDKPITEMECFIMRNMRHTAARKKRRQVKVKTRIHANYVEQRHQLTPAPQRFAGVSGEVIHWMHCALGEDNEAMIDMQFESGRALLIKVEAKPEVVAEWQLCKGGDLEPMPDKKSFERIGWRKIKKAPRPDSRSDRGA